MNDFWSIVLTYGILIVLEIIMIYYVRKQYEEENKLNLCGSIVHVLIYAAHGHVFCISCWNNLTSPPPMNKFSTIGFVIAGIGLILVLYSMDFFCNFGTWAGSNVSGLRTNGIYSYTRNPQFVFYAIFLIGFAIPWWNRYAVLGLFAYCILVFVMVRIEEKHLTKIFGAEYLEYCQRVPRFIGFSHK